ncbi:MAG: hypothetical protein ACK5FX_03905 [Flavobacteriia bacterium]|jgi:hypothetical protein
MKAMNKLMLAGAFALLSFASEAQEVEKAKSVNRTAAQPAVHVNQKVEEKQVIQEETKTSVKSDQPAKPSMEMQKAAINKQAKREIPQKIEKADPPKQ